MSKNARILIVFAWAMEIVGVTGGVMNSAYTTFGEDLPETLLGYLPALPIMALAVAELGRVPLASVVFHKHKVIQGVAIFGIAALGYLAIENWTFGFERIVDLRLRPVNIAAREYSRAEGDLLALQHRRDQSIVSSSSKRDELRRGFAQRDFSIGKLTTQLNQTAESHQNNLAQIREACRLIRERCMVPRSKEEDERYALEVSRLNADLARQHQERSQFQAQLEELTKSDAAIVTALDQRIAFAAARANDVRQELRTASDRSQIHRLASSWYGVNTVDVTPEQFANARMVFATFSAIAIALAGSIAALVYYSRDRVPGTPSTFGAMAIRLVRARRAYYARKRKPLVREVPGPEREVFRDGPPPPIVIEKEVPRFIDRIILIPRFGIRFPVYVNRLFGREWPAKLQKNNEPTAAVSNVKALGKRMA